MAHDPNKVVLGGDKGLVDPNSSRKGVYAQFPAAQLKYSTGWNTAHDQDWKRPQETQARLFVQLPEAERERFLSYFSSESRKYVEAITGGPTGQGGGYIDFLLNSVQESFEEKVQVTEFLSDDYVAYFFGQRPQTFAFQGTLFTTVQDDWWTAFTYLYTQLLRGSMLASYGRLAYVRYDSRMAVGALTHFAAGLSAESQSAVNFSFQMLVKRLDIVPSLKGQPSTHQPTPVARSFFYGLDEASVGRLTVRDPAIQRDVHVTQLRDTAVVKAAPPTEKPAAVEAANAVEKTANEAVYDLTKDEIEYGNALLQKSGTDPTTGVTGYYDTSWFGNTGFAVQIDKDGKIIKATKYGQAIGK